MSDKDKPFGCDIGDMDVEAFYNLREWLEKAITEAGAKVDGAGIGGGQADISFDLEGMRYSVSIKPLPITKIKEQE